jgi:hypothetical protein
MVDRLNTDAADLEWITLIDALRGRCRWNGDKAWVDDAIQDALLQLLMTQSAGIEVQDSVGFCLHVMRCRLIDRLRKVRAHEANSLEDSPVEERICRQNSRSRANLGCQRLQINAQSGSPYAMSVQTPHHHFP